jgi:hypothetical protein
MKASNLDKEPEPTPMPTAREWLRVVAAAGVIILISTVWTFLA